MAAISLFLQLVTRPQLVFIIASLCISNPAIWDLYCLLIQLVAGLDIWAVKKKILNESSLIFLIFKMQISSLLALQGVF